MVHRDRDFLSDVAGILVDYVKDECNVKQVLTCEDPAVYSRVVLAPNLRSLGKRLGKDSGAVAASLKAMDAAQAARLEAEGSMVVAGHTVTLEDVLISREFTAPAGSTELDAQGEADVLVVADLGMDEGLASEGLAREVINRFQKLRKQAGLVPTDRVEARLLAPSAEVAAELDKVLEAHRDSIT